MNDEINKLGYSFIDEDSIEDISGNDVNKSKNEKKKNY